MRRHLSDSHDERDRQAYHAQRADAAFHVQGSRRQLLAWPLGFSMADSDRHHIGWVSLPCYAAAVDLERGCVSLRCSYPTHHAVSCELGAGVETQQLHEQVAGRDCCLVPLL